MSSYHWSIHQIAEIFAAVSAVEDEQTMVQTAIERVAEALDAELVAYVREGVLVAQVGLPRGRPVPTTLLTAGPDPTLDIDGLGSCHVASTSSAGGTDAQHLVAARLHDTFASEERQLLRGMAQVLSLALQTARTLAAERTLRAEKEREAEERQRLLTVVSARERMLQQLLAIQRRISARQPLPEVLQAACTGAQTLLGPGSQVAVVSADIAPQLLADSMSTDWVEPDLRLAAEAVRDHTPAIRELVGGRELAVPVLVDNAADAALVARTAGRTSADIEQHLLEAFAQQVCIAMADARTRQQVLQAQLDDLTGLPSRALFLVRLNEAMQARRSGDVMSLLFIDLDRFKQVNDSLGHDAGDRLLIAVGKRIRGCLRHSDVLARLGGDEFAVLVGDLGRTGAIAVAERIMASLREPFTLAGREVFIAASVGIVEAGPGEQNARSLLSSADVAMYRCKQEGDGKPVVFHPGMRAVVLERLDLQADLQRALAAGELSLAWQPLISLDDRRPVGVEALMRWTHPVRGAVSPAVFVPVAEETGLIVELGRWVVAEAARQVAVWRQEFPWLVGNVNISGRQLAEPDFATEVARLLAAASLPTHALTLELTESLLMADPDGAPGRLRTLRELGVGLSIDDFGTGYSSLSYLRRLPVDELKIDRSFVAGICSDAQDLAVLRTIVELARILGLTTVAEGIETQEQLRLLTQLGCRVGQGFYLSRPLPAADVPAYLRRMCTRQPAAVAY